MLRRRHSLTHEKARSELGTGFKRALITGSQNCDGRGVNRGGNGSGRVNRAAPRSQGDDRTDGGTGATPHGLLSSDGDRARRVRDAHNGRCGGPDGGTCAAPAIHDGYDNGNGREP